MSHTRRNKASEVLRKAHPYKRKRRDELLKEFEIQYIAVNKDPRIKL